MSAPMTPDFRQSELTKVNVESVCNYAKTMSDSVAFSGPLPNLSSDDMFSLVTCGPSIAGCLGGV